MGRTVRWAGGIGAASVLAVTGVAAGRGALLLAAVVPLVYVAVGLPSSVASPSSLRVERSIEPATAPPGERVTVTLTVENAGEGTLPDVRVVDAVPESLAVIDGSPRGGAALDAGETLTVTYSVAAKRGEYRFDDPTVRLRNVTAGAVDTGPVDAAGDARLVCRLDAEAPPIDQQGDRHAGQLTTDAPGHGLEFHSTRPYRPSDPTSRIDWRHYAKQGDLATINYRERRAATVALVVDAREPCRVVAGPGRPTAVELCAYAATHAVDDLLRGGEDVAVAVVGAAGDGPAGLHWLPPGGGRAHRVRAKELLRSASEATATSVDVEAQRDRLTELVPPRAQLVVISPLVDDWPVDAVEAWGTRQHARSVLSPDVLTHNTVTGEFAAVQRHTRLARCQAAGARTVDWRRATPLHVALERAFAADARGTLHTGGGR